MEVGLIWIIFKVERYLDENGKVNTDWNIQEKITIDKSLHKGNTAMTFFPDLQIYSYLRKPSEYKVNLEEAIQNPILKGTPIASMVPADEIYKGIYSYLSVLNDKEIIDDRTDIQKAEAAGFDRKTSFRNIK